MQNVIQPCQQQVTICCADRQRRTDFQNIVKRPVRANQNTVITQSVTDIAGQRASRVLASAVRHQFNTKEQAAPAHIADQGMT